MDVNGDCADIEIGLFSREIAISAFCLFPRSRRTIALLGRLEAGPDVSKF
jgi:hypothetical protein